MERRRGWIGRACGVLLSVVMLAADGAAVELRAGASVVDVTPHTLPVIQNGGFLEAVADRVADPLAARCLVISAADTTVALVVVDNCMIPLDVADRAKQLAAERTQIPSDRILIAATHTHAAPSVMDYCLGSRADSAYRTFLPERIAAAVEAAQRKLAPAQLGWTAVDAPDHTHCRRWITRPDRILTDPFGDRTVRANMHPGHQNVDFVGPSGPVDPALTLLSVRHADGRPLALLANFSMHYFSGHSGLSADYCGRFAHQMQARLAPHDPEFVAIMSQGTSGDLWWGNYERDREQDQRALDDYVNELSALATHALETLTWRDDLKVSMAERRLTMKRRLPTPDRLAWAREIVRRLGDRRPQNQAEVYAEQALYLAEHPEGVVVLQAICIGDFAIAGLPNEVYGLTGLKLKRQTPAALMMNLELANGAEGYIPPPEQHRLGGYNTWPARTAGLEVEAEPKIVETLLEMFESLQGQSRLQPARPGGAYESAVRADAPVAYYRMQEWAGTVVQNELNANLCGELEGTMAFYLPGPSQPAFAARGDNRSMHNVGGSLRTPWQLTQNWTAELWVWNGMVTDVRDVTGTILSSPDGTLACSGTSSPHPGRLQWNGQGGDTTLARNRWYHVAIAASPTEVNVYLDGQLELTVARPVGSAVDEREPVPLRFGSDPLLQFPWEGRLDEIAIYPHALSAERIRRHWDVANQADPAAGSLGSDERKPE